MTKTELYSILTTSLASYWYADANLMESDSETWALVREIDDFLYTHRTNDRMSSEQYQRNVARLRNLFTVPAGEDPLV